MPDGCNSSSILRVTMNINWMKSTMMKSIIMSSSSKESKAVWASYSDYIKKNGNIWKEKKKEIKLNHGIEKANPIKLPKASDANSIEENGDEPSIMNGFGALTMISKKVDEIRYY